MENERKLNLGKVVVTRGIDEEMHKDKLFEVFIMESLSSFESCDWGDTYKEDKEINEEALKNGERILAVYTYPKTRQKIWIITEWDRSVTTILFPNEY